jgi:hypothetical protein
LYIFLSFAVLVRFWLGPGELGWNWLLDDCRAIWEELGEPPLKALLTAIFSVMRRTGSFLSSFSSSAGVY